MTDDMEVAALDILRQLTEADSDKATISLTRSEVTQLAIAFALMHVAEQIRDLRVSFERNDSR